MRYGDAAPDARREAVIETLRAIDPFDDRESASRNEFLAALERLERPFDQDADLVHVTGSAIVVGPRGVVLHVHKRLGIWLQPGGHLDPGEWPADAALRESIEETGLDLRHPDDGPRLVHVDVHPAARGHTHLDLRYLLTASDKDPSPAHGESQQARWFDWDEAIAVADPGLIGALRRLRPSH